MKWALVIWLSGSGSDNFSVYERFVTLENCLDKKQTVSKALDQTNSNMRVVCRPIAQGGQKENKSAIAVNRYTVY
jgi:hypothetical protein